MTKSKMNVHNLFFFEFTFSSYAVKVSDDLSENEAPLLYSRGSEDFISLDSEAETPHSKTSHKCYQEGTHRSQQSAPTVLSKGKTDSVPVVIGQKRKKEKTPFRLYSFKKASK